MSFPLIYFLITALFGFSIVIYIFSINKKEYFWVKYFMISMSIYALGYFFELLSSDFETSIFWLKFQFLGNRFFTTLLFFVALDYSDIKIKKSLKTILLSICLVFIYLKFFHLHLLQDIVAYENNTLMFRAKAGYLLASSMDYILVFISLFLFFKESIKKVKSHRQIINIVSFHIFIGVIISMFRLFNSDVHSHDIMVYVVTFPIYLWGYIIIKNKIFNHEKIDLADVFINSKMAIIVTDTSMNVITENKLAKLTFGNLIHKNIGILSDEIKVEIKKEKTKLENIKICNRIYSVAVSKYRNKGDLYGYIFNFSDITKLEKLNIELYKIHKELFEMDREKEDLMLSISNELRSPLNGIMDVSELLLNNNEGGFEFKENIKTINNSSKYMQKLLNEMIVKEDIEVENFDIRLFVNELEENFRRICIEKGIYILSYVHLDVPEILIGKHDKIRQALLNIISNAIKYTKSGGVLLSVDIREEHSDCLEVRFSVKDTGKGILNVNKIYDLFYSENADDIMLKQNSNRSFGIGLYNTKKIVDSLNGKLNVESEVGVGTTFFADFKLKSKNNKIRAIKL